MIGKKVLQPAGYEAFIPDPFPDKKLFNFSESIIKKATDATRLLGKLDGITLLLPDIDFFIFMYIRKDAAASSQIEGTKATMVDAIEAEINIESFVDSDVDDIILYIKALKYGIVRLKEFPLSLRFIREIHKELMENGRKSHFSDPGRFRKTQNWIDGRSPSDAYFVPPPVEQMNTSLDHFEKFINKNDSIPSLIKAAIIHAQFETIHPFLDGNGRTGRMLITFYLLNEKILEKPVLYLSSYFKKHQKLYYSRLTNYHESNIESWINFFLDGVIETADSAINTVQKITVLRENDIRKISQLNKISSESAMKILPKLFAQPIVTVKTIQEWTGFTTRTGAQKFINRLIELDILKIKDDTVKYGKSYFYKNYLEIFLNY